MPGRHDRFQNTNRSLPKSASEFLESKEAFKHHFKFVSSTLSSTIWPGTQIPSRACRRYKWQYVVDRTRHYRLKSGANLGNGLARKISISALNDPVKAGWGDLVGKLLRVGAQHWLLDHQGRSRRCTTLLGTAVPI